MEPHEGSSPCRTLLGLFSLLGLRGVPRRVWVWGYRSLFRTCREQILSDPPAVVCVSKPDDCFLVARLGFPGVTAREIVGSNRDRHSGESHAVTRSLVCVANVQQHGALKDAGVRLLAVPDQPGHDCPTGRVLVAEACSHIRRPQLTDRLPIVSVECGDVRPDTLFRRVGVMIGQFRQLRARAGAFQVRRAQRLQPASVRAAELKDHFAVVEPHVDRRDSTGRETETSKQGLAGRQMLRLVRKRPDVEVATVARLATQRHLGRDEQ